MFEFLSKLFDTSDFPPRWHCGAWTPGHGWLHILSDLGVWSAYLAIPSVLGYFILRRKELPFRLVFLLFGAFILACGTTHLMEAIIFWWPAYLLAGVIKLVTAIVSWATVFALVRVVPMALTMRSPAELEREVAHRRRAEDALQQSHGELERRVGERTQELAAANLALHAEIVERKRAEEALRESQRFLSSSLDALADHIAVLDEEGKILLINDAWRRFSLDNGYLGTDDGIGENYLLACGDDGNADGDGVVRGIRDVMARRSPFFEQEYPCHGPEGRRWFLLRVTSFESQGAVRAVVAHEDITRRKLAEDEVLTAKVEAENANKAKDHFLAVLSHELRTPLNPILLAASSMLEGAFEPSEIRPTLEMIRQNVKLQARLIDDLLDVMRIVQGKMPLHWGVSDCHALIGQSVEICRSEFLGKAQGLVLDLVAEHHHVNADSARLHQVLWNLVRNAVKFTPEGGTISVRTRNEGSEERNVVIEVSDTGIGIEPDVLPTIWDPFQQGETTITRRFGGLGLGLAICKGVVDAHGGTLTAESEGPGRGTTFRVVLKAMTEPVIPASGAENGEDHPALPPLNRLNILLVEDEAATLRLMARLLKGLGHRVTSAGTVADAWVAFQAGDFDMIVSDIGLPDGTGLDLLRKVKAVRRVPAIALTGYGMDEDVRRSREAGFTTHMTKPIDFTKLEAMIRQVAN